MNQIECKKLYEAYSLDVYRYAMHLLQNREEAEDVTSEVFTKVMQNPGNLDYVENVKAWLIAVTRNTVYDGFRKKREASMPITEEGEYAEIPDINQSVEESVITNELIELIQRELHFLDSQTSEVIILRIWEQLQFNEIAQVTQESESTVKLRFYRGIKKIKNIITSQDKSQRLHSLALPVVIVGLGKIAAGGLYTPSLQFSQTLAASLFTSVASTAAYATATSITAAAAVTGTGIATAVVWKVVLTVVATGVLTLGGIFVASQYSKPEPAESNNSIPEEVVIPEDIQEETPALPQGYAFTTFEECGTTIPVPPQTVVGPTKWIVTDINGGVFDNQTYGKLLSIVTTDSNGAILGNDDPRGKVIINCIPNTSGKTLNQAVLDIKAATESKNTPQFLTAGLPPFSVTELESLNFKGFDAKRIRISGGFNPTNNDWYVFVTPKLIRVVRMSPHNEDLQVNETVQVVFDNLEFFEPLIAPTPKFIPEPSVAVNALPEGFTYVSVPGCKVRVPVPPQNASFNSVLNENMEMRWTHKTDSSMLRFSQNNNGWEGIVVSYLTYSISTNQIMGSGDISKSILLACQQNVNNQTLEQKLTDIKQQWESNDFSAMGGASAATTLTSNGETTYQGRRALRFTLGGGISDSIRRDLVLFENSGYFYLVNKLYDYGNNQSANQILDQIENSIEFN